METLERKRIATDSMYDDSKGSHFLTATSKTNQTGLVTPYNTINSALQMSSDPSLKRFQTDYADIIRGEIGEDTVQSQKAYSKYVKNDNSLRYIDKDIETNYTNS